jgi:hypothetical protein
VDEDVVDKDTEMDVTNVAEYVAEALVELEFEDMVLEVELKEGDVADTDVADTDVAADDEDDVVVTVLDELEDAAGAGTTMVTGGEFTSMIEYPVVVTVAGDGVSVTTTVWSAPDSSMVFVEII